jgi:CP family cyanate transporter-like MFS transporter
MNVRWFYLVLLWLAGIDLRVTILAVPPVLRLMHRDIALNETAVGVLTGLPVLLLGAAAIGGALLIAKMGARRAWLVGLLLIGIGSAARGAGPSIEMLFAMTLLMGVGIAVCQPAAPTIVGEWFPRSIGLATAVYVNGLLVGEALSAGLTIPYVLPLVRMSWEWSLFFWSLPVFLTIVLWVPFTRSSGAHRTQRGLWWPDWRDPLVWRLGVLQAATSVTYFGCNAFMPDYLHEAGRVSLISASLTALNVGQLPASFLTLMTAHRVAGRNQIFAVLGVLSLAGIIAFCATGGWIAVAGAGLVGFAAAFSLVMIFALPAMVTHQENVHRLSAGMLTLGYIGAFLGNLLGGAIWDVTHQALTAFAPAILGAFIMLVVGASSNGRIER